MHGTQNAISGTSSLSSEPAPSPCRSTTHPGHPSGLRSQDPLHWHAGFLLQLSSQGWLSNSASHTHPSTATPLLAIDCTWDEKRRPLFPWPADISTLLHRGLQAQTVTHSLLFCSTTTDATRHHTPSFAAIQSGLEAARSPLPREHPSSISTERRQKYRVFPSRRQSTRYALVTRWSCFHFRSLPSRDSETVPCTPSDHARDDQTEPTWHHWPSTTTNADGHFVGCVCVAFCTTAWHPQTRATRHSLPVPAHSCHSPVLPTTSDLARSWNWLPGFPRSCDRHPLVRAIDYGSRDKRKTRRTAPLSLVQHQHPSRPISIPWPRGTMSLTV